MIDDWFFRAWLLMMAYLIVVPNEDRQVRMVFICGGLKRRACANKVYDFYIRKLPSNRLSVWRTVHANMRWLAGTHRDCGPECVVSEETSMDGAKRAIVVERTSPWLIDTLGIWDLVFKHLRGGEASPVCDTAYTSDAEA